MTLIAELKRRNVLKVGAAYLVVAWLAVQAASIAFPTFEAPPWALRVFVFVALLGFPVALVIAWNLQMTPEGVRVEPAATGNRGISVIAAALVALAVAWYFVGQPTYRHDAPAPAPVGRAPSVAVLPFVNLSDDREQEFFSDGMTEELLNVLARIPTLKVAARTSVFEFKGKGGDVREIGRKLGVNHIVEGSVRRDGQRVRVTAQLIRVGDGFHVWSETYDRELAGVFALQDDIARRVGEQLRTSLGVAVDPLARVGIAPEAYDDYLKGRALYRQRKDVAQAIAHLEAAVARTPDFAAGWSSLALAYEVVGGYATAEQLAALGNVFAKAQAAAQRAAALDPEAAMTLHALADVARWEFRYADAERLCMKAIHADPSYPDVREDYSELLSMVGRHEEALAATRLLVTLEPFVAVFWRRMLEVATELDRRDLFDEAAARARAIDAAYVSHVLAEFDFHLARGRIEPARAALAVAMQRAPEVAATDAVLFRWAVGDPGVADAPALRVLRSAYSAAVYPALRGDADLFFSLYEETEEPHSVRLDFYDHLSLPPMQAMLADRRAKELLTRYGFVAYWREKGWPALCRPLGADDFECGAAATEGG